MIDAAPSPPTVATPTMRVDGINDMTLATSTPSAAIHYTLDGTTPDAASTLYTKPIVMPGGTTTVSAVAFKDGFLPSAMLRFAFAYDQGPLAVSAPSIAPNGGAFEGPVSVTMQCATPNAVIFTPWTAPNRSRRVRGTSGRSRSRRRRRCMRSQRFHRSPTRPRPSRPFTIVDSGTTVDGGP